MKQLIFIPFLLFTIIGLSSCEEDDDIAQQHHIYYFNNFTKWGEIEIFNQPDGSQQKICHIYEITPWVSWTNTSNYCKWMESNYGNHGVSRLNDFTIYQEDEKVVLTHEPSGKEVIMYDFTQMTEGGTMTCNGFKVNSVDNSVETFTWKEPEREILTYSDGIIEPVENVNTEVVRMAFYNDYGTLIMKAAGPMPGRLKPHRVPVIYDDEPQPDEIILLYLDRYFHPQYYELLKGAEFVYEDQIDVDWKSWKLPVRETDPWH